MIKGRSSYNFYVIHGANSIYTDEFKLAIGFKLNSIVLNSCELISLDELSICATEHLILF